MLSDSFDDKNVVFLSEKEKKQRFLFVTSVFFLNFAPERKKYLRQSER